MTLLGMTLLLVIVILLVYFINYLLEPNNLESPNMYLVDIDALLTSTSVEQRDSMIDNINILYSDTENIVLLYTTKVNDIRMEVENNLNYDGVKYHGLIMGDKKYIKSGKLLFGKNLIPITYLKD